MPLMYSNTRSNLQADVRANAIETEYVEGIVKTFPRSSMTHEMYTLNHPIRAWVKNYGTGRLRTLVSRDSFSVENELHSGTSRGCQL